MTIPSRLSDYQFNFILGDNRTHVSQNDTIVYEIQYGAYKSAYFDTPLTITADFSNDLAAGLDLVHYVPNSATYGYSNTIPVVDLINRTITWTIPSLPAGVINQSVKFMLQANDAYTNPNDVNFTITASMNTPTLVFPNQSFLQTYRYFIPAIVIQPTATPTPIPPYLSPFLNIIVIDITSQEINLNVITRIPVVLTLCYGPSPNSLDKCINTDVFSKNQKIGITGLNPNTKYYFRLQATDKAGIKTYSDMYHFTSGGATSLATIDQTSIVLLSSNVILYLSKDTQPSAQATIPTIVLPENVPYSFNFRLQNGSSVKKAHAIVRNKYVLGISTQDSKEPNTFANDLIEAAGGIFTGSLKTPSTKGLYQLFVSFEDSKGNIVERLLVNLDNLDPFTVKDKITRQPIENAKVTWYYKNLISGQYTLLPPDLFQTINNPDFTNRNGSVITQFPQGQYKANISAYGYKNQEVLFTIGTSKTQIYPAVYLMEEPFNALGTISYSVNIVSQLLNTTKLYLLSVANSNVFFIFNADTIIACLVFLTFSSFTRRIGIPVVLLFSYFLHIIKHKHSQVDVGKIPQQLLDAETKTPISKASIFFVDSKTNRILHHSTSNSEGYFVNGAITTSDNLILVMKDGYEFNTFKWDNSKEKPLIFELTKIYHHTSLIEDLKLFVQKTLSILFEALLLLSLTSEVALGYVLGFEKVYIFLSLSMINLIIWIIHLMHLRNISEISDNDIRKVLKDPLS